MSPAYGTLFLFYLLLSLGMQMFWSLQFPIYLHCGRLLEFFIVAAAIFSVSLDVGRGFAGTVIFMYVEDGECDLDPYPALRAWTYLTLVGEAVIWPLLPLFGLHLCRAQPSALFHPRQFAALALDPAEDIRRTEDVSGENDGEVPSSTAALDAPTATNRPQPPDLPFRGVLLLAVVCSSTMLSFCLVETLHGLCSTVNSGVYLYAPCMARWQTLLGHLPVCLWLLGVGWVLWLTHRWPWMAVCQAVAAAALVAATASDVVAFNVHGAHRLLTIFTCLWAHHRVYNDEVEALAEGDQQPFATALRLGSVLTFGEPLSDPES